MAVERVPSIDRAMVQAKGPQVREGNTAGRVSATARAASIAAVPASRTAPPGRPVTAAASRVVAPVDSAEAAPVAAVVDSAVEAAPAEAVAEEAAGGESWRETTHRGRPYQRKGP